MRQQAVLAKPPIDWRSTWRRARGVVVVALFLVGLVLLIDWLGRPPQFQAAAEAQLDRPVMAFALWDNTPYVVFDTGDSGLVYFDRLRIDWISIEWPPTPHWQWTGFDWSYIDMTTDPASAGLTTWRGGNAVFGQLNAPEIVTLALRIDGAWRGYPVSAPGYAVRPAGFDQTPSGYRWLDAAGQVLWEVNEPSTVGP